MAKNLQFNEDELKEIATQAIKEKVASSIGYQDMRPFIQAAMDERSDDIKTLLAECLDSVLSDESTKDIIREEFRHKVAKNLVSNLEGAVEKSVNAFRQDPTVKAKMILAIEQIIEENKPA